MLVGAALSCVSSFNPTVLVVSLQRLLTDISLVWKSSMEALSSEGEQNANKYCL